MMSLRRHLGSLTAIWLLFQVASLSALLPGVCCLAHAEDPASDPESCHKEEAATTADQCPMMSADGQPCPEHVAHTASGERCVMMGTCNAPMSSLASLFSAPAVLVDRTVLLFDTISAAVTIQSQSALVVSLAFDTPPPRL
jgi:hypothetical protein